MEPLNIVTRAQINRWILVRKERKGGLNFSTTSRCKMENVREIFFDEEKEYFGCL